MPQVFEHFADAAFVGKPHDNETPLRGICVFQGRGVAPEATGSAHDRFIKARVWKVEDPYFIDFVPGHALQDLEAIDDFDGSVVMVTHNEMHLRAVATKLIVFDNDAIKVYAGTYDDFLNDIGWSDEEIKI